MDKLEILQRIIVVLMMCVIIALIYHGWAEQESYEMAPPAQTDSSKLPVTGDGEIGSYPNLEKKSEMDSNLWLEPSNSDPEDWKPDSNELPERGYLGPVPPKPEPYGASVADEQQDSSPIPTVTDNDKLESELHSDLRDNPSEPIF